jgi:flagellar hook-associated protein 3
MLINNMINYIGNNLTRMDKYQNQLATGKKISVPSDDPVVAARALKLRTDVAEVDQYQKNVKDAQSWMEITEDSLAKIGDVLQKTRELTVQGANGTNTTDDTKKINEEIKQLRTQILHLGNSTYAGRYIFSGYKTDQKLLDETTGNFSINVLNNENIKYEIGIGDDIEINVPGGDLFNNGGNGITIGNADVSSLTIPAAPNNTLSINVDGDAFVVNITPKTYTSINALAAEIQTQINTNKQPETQAVSVTATGNRLKFTSGSTGSTSQISINAGASTAALNLGLTDTTQTHGTSSAKGKLVDDFDKLIVAFDNGDHDTIGNLLANIDGDMDNVLRIRADIGARMNRIELTNNRLDSDNISFTKLMSVNEDVDMAETIMNLQNEENVYKASLSGGARVIQPTLVDFLR